ncbi:MAG TPA: putative PEP-binding protein, partial [bacterium]|nr:putative PEP-binding protein [bacterium]
INIGSNDLLQFTLAASRENPEVYKRYHSLHPALIRLIKIIVARARKYDKEASLCGEIANYEQAYPLFLDLGVTSFSVPVSKHAIIKHKISQIDTNDLDGIQEKFMNSMHKESTQNLLNDL